MTDYRLAATDYGMPAEARRSHHPHAGSRASRVGIRHALSAVVVLVCLLLPFAATAQTGDGQDMQNMPGMQHGTPQAEGWQWTQDASAFFGLNDQERKFRDFHAWESQN